MRNPASGRRSSRNGAIATTCRKRRPAMIATSVNRRPKRVSSTSSLRMFWTVLKPISGRNSPNAMSAVSAVSRKARMRRGGAMEWATSSRISTFLHVGPAENALRQEDHHDRQNREGGHVFVGARHVFGPQRLDDADQEPAQHRPRQRADAAEYRRGERLYAGHEAVVEAHHAVEREIERARHRCERGSDHEGDRNRAIDVDADERRHFLVLLAGALRT